MNKTTLLVLLCLFYGITHAQIVTDNRTPLERATYYLQEKGEVVFTFQAQNQSQFQELSSFLSISHKRVDPTELKVEAYANAGEFQRFQEYGIPFQVNVSDNEFTADQYTTFSTQAWDDTWNAYPTYTQYVAKMEYYAATYPTLCTLEEIGNTVLGRKLLVLKISDNAGADEAEPEFFYSSSMHGDELAGFPLMMRLIDHLLTNYGTDTEITNLVNGTEIYICPYANPDGGYRDITNNTLNTGGLASLQPRRGNANNIDLNRNYPDPQDGLHPDGNAYQSETLAFLAFEKNRNFAIAANYHGGAEVVNYPWDTYVAPSNIHPHDNHFKHFSLEYAQLCQSASGNNGYMDDVLSTGASPGITNGSAWYSVNGGRQDYNNYFNHNKEVTIEVSATKFLSGSSLPAHWNYNRQAFLNLIKQAGYGLNGKVTDASGNPVEAKVYINGYDLMGSWIKTTALHGDYHKTLYAGTYNVIFEAPGYTTQTHSVTVTNNAATVLNVTMAAVTGQPTASNATICEGQTASLTATGTGTLKWYSSQNATSEIATGTSFTTPALVTSTSYFVENQTTLSPVGPATIANGGVVANSTAAGRYLTFNSTQTTRLKSVKINTSAAGELMVELQNSSGTMLESKVIRLTASGTQDIELDFFVPVATGLRLVLRQISGFSIYRSNASITYPMTNGTISITGNSGTGTFFHFFEWKFQPTKSTRKEVVVTVKPNPTLATISPDTEIAGSQSFTLTVTGTNFVNGESVIRWNGNNKATTFVSATELTTTITALEIASSGSAAVTVLNTCNSFSTEPTSFEITAPTTTTWDGAAWSYGIPTSTVDAIINGNYTTAENGTFTAQSLTVNSGFAITVNSGTSIAIANAITNNGGANGIIIESNANLIQTNEAVNTGLVTVRRNSAPMYRYDYTLWSSPVSGQNLKDFSPATLSNRFYIYNPVIGTNGNYETIFPAQDQASYNFEKAKGYLVRSPDTYADYSSAAVPGVSYLGTFVGIPYNGNYNFPLSNANNGFNLTGNPYPSAISISGLFASNSNAIDGTIWFWRKRNGVPGSGYATSTGLGVTSAHPEATAIDPNGIITAGQGFFVKVKAGATQSGLTFNNAMRSSTSGNTFFRTDEFATDSQEIERHRIWINLSNETNLIGQTLVGYMTGATNGIDYGIEGKYFGDSPIALTSFIDNTEYAIQGRSLPFTPSDVVPLKFKTNISGNYIVSIDAYDGLFEADQDIFLLDNFTGQTHDLKASDYSFSSESGEFTNRFEIVYQSALGVENPMINPNTIVIYKKNQVLYINSGNYRMEKIELFDISGRLIYSKENVGNTSETLSNLNIANQVLLVKITTEANGIANKKIVF